MSGGSQCKMAQALPGPVCLCRLWRSAPRGCGRSGHPGPVFAQRLCQSPLPLRSAGSEWRACQCRLCTGLSGGPYRVGHSAIDTGDGHVHGLVVAAIGNLGDWHPSGLNVTRQGFNTGAFPATRCRVYGGDDCDDGCGAHPAGRRPGRLRRRSPGSGQRWRRGADPRRSTPGRSGPGPTRRSRAFAVLDVPRMAPRMARKPASVAAWNASGSGRRAMTRQGPRRRLCTGVPFRAVPRLATPMQVSPIRGYAIAASAGRF